MGSSDYDNNNNHNTFHIDYYNYDNNNDDDHNNDNDDNNYNFDNNNDYHNHNLYCRKRRQKSIKKQRREHRTMHNQEIPIYQLLKAWTNPRSRRSRANKCSS